ncbi:MAG: MCE family protein, partial [Candidatus Eremiobacteraeota bacterium]|nr:MCE family protein [Candidatus Eremiobacteraeota bacterium]
MNKQAQVGLFTILGLVAVFAVFFVLADFGTRAAGYKIGVHFRAASGLRNGAIVYLSGVPIGAVDDISLLPAYSTEVHLAIKPSFEIPVNARFLIQAPITGDPSVLIEPPVDVDRSVATLPHEVLPIEQQPRGTNPTSFADLLEQGQGEVRRLDDLLAEFQKSEPVLLAELQSTLHNANALTTNANVSLSRVTTKVEALTDSLQRNLTVASDNVVSLTGGLNSVVQRDSVQVDALLAQLSHTSKSFGETVDSLHDVATNPHVKANLIDTTRDFAATAKAFAELTNDLRNVTGNPQTQAQLRDTVAQLDATSQKVDSLVGQLGGTSKVYGVDPNASPPAIATPVPPGFVPTSQPVLPPAPVSSSSPAPGASSPAYGAPAGTSRDRGSPGVPSSSTALANLRNRLNGFTKDLV